MQQTFPYCQLQMRWYMKSNLFLMRRKVEILHQIEEITRLQSESPKWHALRRERLTASVAGEIVRLWSFNWTIKKHQKSGNGEYAAWLILRGSGRWSLCAAARQQHQHLSMWNHCQSSCPLACCKSRQESLPTINESTIWIIRDQVSCKTIGGVLVS